MPRARMCIQRRPRGWASTSSSLFENSEFDLCNILTFSTQQTNKIWETQKSEKLIKIIILFLFFEIIIRKGKLILPSFDNS